MIMKKAFKFIISIIVLSLFIYSCKKKDSTTAVLQKVQAKWSIVRIIDHFHDPGSIPADTTDTYTGVNGDYIDFRTDGKAYTNLGGSADTSGYTLSGDTSIIIASGGNYKIQTLTSNAFTLYGREDDPSSLSYYEETINLKK